MSIKTLFTGSALKWDGPASVSGSVRVDTNLSSGRVVAEMPKLGGVHGFSQNKAPAQHSPLALSPNALSAMTPVPVVLTKHQPSVAGLEFKSPQTSVGTDRPPPIPSLKPATAVGVTGLATHRQLQVVASPGMDGSDVDVDQLIGEVKVRQLWQQQSEARWLPAQANKEAFAALDAKQRGVVQGHRADLARMEHPAGPQAVRSAQLVKDLMHVTPPALATHGKQVIDKLGKVVGGSLEVADLALTQAVLNAAGVTANLDRMPNGKHFVVQAQADGSRKVMIDSHPTDAEGLIKHVNAALDASEHPVRTLEQLRAQTNDVLGQIEALEKAGKTREATELAMQFGLDAITTTLLAGAAVYTVGRATMSTKQALKNRYKTLEERLRPEVFWMNNEAYVKLAQVWNAVGQRVKTGGEVFTKMAERIQQLGLNRVDAFVKKLGESAAKGNTETFVATGFSRVGMGAAMEEGVRTLGLFGVLGAGLFGQARVHLNDHIPYKQHNAHKDSANITLEVGDFISFSAWVKKDDFRNYYFLDKGVLDTGDFSNPYGRLQNGKLGAADLFRYSKFVAGMGINIGPSNFAIRNQIELRFLNATMPGQGLVDRSKKGQGLRKMLGADGHITISPLYINSQGGFSIGPVAYNLREISSFRWFSLGWPPDPVGSPVAKFNGRALQNVFFNATLNPAHFFPEWVGAHQPEFVINGAVPVLKGKPLIEKVDPRQMLAKDWRDVRLIDNGRLRPLGKDDRPLLMDDGSVGGLDKPAVWLMQPADVAALTSKDIAALRSNPDKVLVQEETGRLRSLDIAQETIVVDAKGQAWAVPVEHSLRAGNGKDPASLGAAPAYLLQSNIRLEDLRSDVDKAPARWTAD